MTFEEWFNEVENFSFRSERFYDDLAQYQDGDQDRMIAWLKAAYESGIEKGYELGCAR